MLVLGVTVEGHARRLQDMGGGQASRRHAPPPLLPHQRGLGLGSGETELAGVARGPPGRLILPERPETRGDLMRFQPVDRILCAPQGRQALGTDELHGSGAVLADCAESAKGFLADTWKWRAHRSMTTSLSGSSPHKKALTGACECSARASGIDRDRG